MRILLEEEVKITPDSLGGKNGERSLVGTRSSRVRATLLGQIRKCDQAIQKLDKELFFVTIGGHFWSGHATAIKKRRDRWDEKRKLVRLKRKGYL